MSNLIRIEDMQMETTPEIDKFAEIMRKRIEIGMRMVFDSGKIKTNLPQGTRLSHITKEFKNIPEYQKALFKADKYILKEEEIPAELKAKLIRAKNDIEKYEKEHDIRLYFGY